MQNPNQAQEAWEKYLEKDSASPWANEARKNSELLKQKNRTSKDKSQILQDFLDAFHKKDDERAWEVASQTKELITDIMIQQQLARRFLKDSQQSRKEAASKILSAFVYLGELEKQNAKDLYFAELSDYYSKTNQIQQQKLIEAHTELQKGNELIRNTDFVSALEAFNRAQNLFVSAGNIWEARLAEQRIGYCLSRLDKIKESEERLTALSAFCEQNQYKWLQTMTDGWNAENYYFSGESSKAISYNQKALKLALETSDTYNIHRVLVQFSEVYQAIGDSRKALFFTYQNLILPESYHTFPRQKWRDLNYASEALHRFKLYDAAVAFGKESVDFARNETKDNWMLSTSHRNLAMIYGELRRFREANEHIEANLQLSRTFTNEKLRKRLFSDSTQILGDLQRLAGDCSSAIENYNQSIENSREMEFSIFRYSARRGKLFCNLAQKNDAAVKEEFAAILQMFDEDRKKIKEDSEQNTYFDIEQSVYDAAINYAFTTAKDTEAAFNYAENSRARSLIDLVQVNSEKLLEPLSAAQIQWQIPAEVQVIYYAVLPDKILTWYISNTKFTAFETDIKENELVNKVADYRKSLLENGGQENTRTSAKQLYDLLIKPIESSLEKEKILCFIADKQLFQLPFASLVSPKSDKYLIEDYALFSAPSATIFIKETETARRKASAENEQVLSIGNPAFTRKEYPELADLPAAAQEAKEIAGFYDSSKAKIFLGKEAGKEQVIGNLNDADVVHFAGHYVPNSVSPSLSKLLLAAGDLPVEEITQNNLPRVRLIILSACETGTEKFYNGEGMIGAARAFLAADVPLVVASQWSVESESTAELMIKFHRYRKTQNLTTIEALRRAQIDLLTDKESRFHQPFYWAGFLPIGGYAAY
jgi:CHAT domain-containing protein